MHLALLREYLDFEFSSLKDVPGFTYDFERVIDDFILMAFFVGTCERRAAPVLPSSHLPGNDFLPSLPTLHINSGALAYMFSVYKEIMPTYIMHSL